MKSDELNAVTGVCVGHFLFKLSRDMRRLGLCLVQRDARLETANHLIAVSTDLAQLAAQIDWRQHVRHQLERGHDADDGVSLIVELDRLIDDVWIGTETLCPELVTEHDDFPAAVLILIRRKRATEQWRHTDHAEIIS